MTWSNIFSVLAALVIVIVYRLYFKQTIKGQSDPNPATWITWLFLGAFNFAAFLLSSENDWIKTITLIVVNICIIWLIIYCLIKGRFSKLGENEIISIVAMVIILIIWGLTKKGIISTKLESEVLALILFQGVYVISFFPTIDGLIKGKSEERHPPWTLSVFAYCLLILSIATDPESTKILYIHPIVNGILCNGIVALLSYLKNKKHNEIAQY